MNSSTAASKVNKSRRALRRLALVFCVLFIAASALSLAFVITHANHTHNRGSADGACTTCISLRCAENLLKQITISTIALAVLLCGLFAVLCCLMLSWLPRRIHTLISLKVQLNN